MRLFHEKEKARLRPGRLACMILRCGLPVVLAVPVWIIVCLCRIPNVADPGLLGECREMMQIALCSFCIVVGGASYGDVLERRSSGKQ